MPRRSELAEDKGGCCETADQLLHSQTSALDKFACVLLVIDSRCLGAVSEEPQSLALLLCEWGPAVHDRLSLVRALPLADNSSAPLFQLHVEMAAQVGGAAPAPAPAPARTLHTPVKWLHCGWCGGVSAHGTCCCKEDDAGLAPN